MFYLGKLITFGTVKISSDLFYIIIIFDEICWSIYSNTIHSGQEG